MAGYGKYNIALTHRPLPTLLALAAQLRLGALGLLVEVLAALGAGRLAAALRRRMVRDIGRFEKFATGILVLMALKTLPSMPQSRLGSWPRAGGAVSARLARRRASPALSRTITTCAPCGADSFPKIPT